MKLLKQLNIIAIAFGLCLILFFTTCKKYPEDKFISLRKPTNRLVGNWKIKEYNFNGNSVIDIINNKTATFDIRDLFLEITKKDGKIPQHYRFSPYNYLSVDGDDDPLEDNTKFGFISHPNQTSFGGKILNFVFITPLSYRGANYTKWDIKNLYLNKMHLQLKTDSGNYDIYFEK